MAPHHRPASCSMTTGTFIRGDPGAWLPVCVVKGNKRFMAQLHGIHGSAQGRAASAWGHPAEKSGETGPYDIFSLHSKADRKKPPHVTQINHFGVRMHVVRCLQPDIEKNYNKTQCLQRKLVAFLQSRVTCKPNSAASWSTQEENAASARQCCSTKSRLSPYSWARMGLFAQCGQRGYLLLSCPQITSSLFYLP